ncbi:ElyC/SanA/YdcF family protein [Marinicellulosiphila megalodicopiae]|uniref:ElyC/SanA/YdcF family protein n=1 Tax=Marinicellulosiphila megalodicopiae TaxID=2724896 RepID=UPI003BB20F08
MLEPLEYAHPSYTNQSASFIHVLGNGHIEDDSLPITSQLTYVSTVRMTEAVRVYYQNPTAKLILTGYAGANTEISTAKMHEQLALALGVPAQNIIINEEPRDTQEESLVVKSIVGDQPVIVITTANHMRRAMGFYELAGLNAIPAPTMHLSRQGNDMKFTDLYPHAEFLRMSQFAIHEWIGILYQKIQG